MTIDIRTASIYPLATLRERTAGTMTVLTMRKWPRGVSKFRLLFDYWIKDAGPSAPLLKSYQDDIITWEVFAQQYQDEQRDRVGCTMKVFLRYGEDLAEMTADSPYGPIVLIHRTASSKGPLTLLCHEQGDEDTVLCHRRLLTAMVREAAKETVTIQNN